MNVSFTPIEPGDGRAAANVNTILTALVTASTAAVGSENFRQEGLDERALADGVTWDRIEPPLESNATPVNIVDPGGAVYGVLVMGAVTFQTTSFTIPTGDFARVTGALQFPTDTAGPQYGVPSPRYVEIALEVSVGGVATVRTVTQRRVGGAIADGQWGPAMFTTVIAAAAYDWVRLVIRADAACTYRVGFASLIVEHLKEA